MIIMKFVSDLLCVFFFVLILLVIILMFFCLWVFVDFFVIVMYKIIEDMCGVGSIG